MPLMNLAQFSQVKMSKLYRNYLAIDGLPRPVGSTANDMASKNISNHSNERSSRVIQKVTRGKCNWVELSLYAAKIFKLYILALKTCRSSSKRVSMSRTRKE